MEFIKPVRQLYFQNRSIIFKAISIILVNKNILLYIMLMLIQDREISDLIMKISKHYTENIATRFLRPLFAQIFADSTLNRRIADLTEHSNDFVIQGFHLEELYFNIIAMSQFIFFTKRDILPNIHTLRDDNLKNSGNDKVYRSMAFNNLPANINILAQDLKLLYERALKYDEVNSPRNRRVSATIPELASVEKMLNEK